MTFLKRIYRPTRVDTLTVIGPCFFFALQLLSDFCRQQLYKSSPPPYLLANKKKELGGVISHVSMIV